MRRADLALDPGQPGTAASFGPICRPVGGCPPSAAPGRARPPSGARTSGLDGSSQGIRQA